MKPLRPAILLLAVQLLLVLSIAAKYLYERHTRPRIWVRAAAWDPATPLRGRYFSFQLLADTCALPRDPAHYHPSRWNPNASTASPGFYTWPATFGFRDGKYQAILAPNSLTDVITLYDSAYELCDRIPSRTAVPLFVPDTARSPLPLPPNEDLWIEVTVPKTGPPRAIQLARATPTTFTPLPFN